MPSALHVARDVPPATRHGVNPNQLRSRQVVPQVSVILPVYNGAPWLAESIQSVLAQTFEQLELIVIDDGSVDDSWSVISAFKDPRVRAIRQTNRGLAATLNVGIKLSQTEFIARQDQDDLMDPERLARQFAFLKNNPRVVAVGTRARILANDRLTSRELRHPLESRSINLFLLFDNPFVHSSMMLRRKAVESLGGYCEDRSRQPPEDYELWSRMSVDFELVNLGDVLTTYREVQGSMSRAGANPFGEKLIEISAENLYRVLGRAYSEDKCRELSRLFHGVRSNSMIELREAMRMIDLVALRLGGAKSNWSQEYRGLYRALKRRVFIRRALMLIPVGTVTWLIHVKRRILQK